MLGDEVQLRKDHRDHVLFVRVAFDTDPDTVHELSDLFEAELRLQHRGSSNIIYCIAIIMMLWPMFAKNNVTLAF